MIRPSSLKYIEICSDFEQPEQTEVHPVTEAGSRLHEAMETGDLSKIEEDEIWMYDRASRARSDLMTDVFGDAEPTVHKELILEIAGEYAGMVDHFALNDKVGLLIDYKFGFHKVDDPDVNIQFQDYTLKLFDKFTQVDTIVVAMIEPRRDEVTRHTYTRADVSTLRNRTKMVQERAGTGQRKASTNCQYCSHIGTCQEAYSKFAAAKHQGDLLPTIRPDWDLSQPMDLEKALDLRPIVKKFLDEWDKAVTSSAKQLLEEGYAVGNYYLQQRAGRKQVVDIDLVREKAAGQGVQPKDFDKCLSLSLTSLGNLIKDFAPKGKKTRHWDEFLDSCATAIEQSEPTEVIAKRK
jgi:hypothetical protein